MLLEDFIRYSLNPEGMSSIITGIGLIDDNDDPQRDQLVANLAAAQTASRLTAQEKKDIEQTVAELHGTRTNFFPADFGRIPNGAGLCRGAQIRQPCPGELAFGLRGGRADRPLRDLPPPRADRRGGVPSANDARSFVFEDKSAPRGASGGLYYKVRAVDEAGARADTLPLKA